MNYRLWFWTLNVFSSAIRLLVIGKIGLTIDEAHYFTYTKYLSLSYFDHPPLIAYLIKMSNLVFQNNIEFAVRFPAVLIFFLSSWIFFICAKKLYNEKTAFVSVLLLNVLPVFSFLGAVVAVPDSPLALFWLLSLLAFIKVIEASKGKFWYLFGICTGFAMLSKYNAVLLPVCATLFLVLSKKHRFWFTRKEPYIAVFISFIMFLPVIVWNIQTNWASFGFQLGHGFGSSIPKFSFNLLAKALGAQAGYISPLLFLTFIAATFLCFKDIFKKKDETSLFIVCFSVPILFLFNFIATFHEILPHWPIMGYLVLSIYVANLTLKFWNIKWFKIYSYLSWGLAVFMVVIVPLHILYGIVPIKKFLPQKQIENVKYGISEAERIDITNEVYGWKEVGAEIEKILDSYPKDNKPFIFTYKSYLASELQYCVPDLRVFCISDIPNAYNFWQTDLKKFKNKKGLFICNDFFFANPQDRYGTQAFASYEQIKILPIYRNDEKIKNFFFTLCKSFNPSKLSEEYSKSYTSKNNIFKELRRYDYAAFRFINGSLKCKILDFFMAPISYCDSKDFNVSFFVILIISLLILWQTKKDTFWTNFALLASVLAVSSAIVYFMKNYFERPRPLSVFGSENVNTLYEQLHRNALPSGHTEIAVAVCMFMLIQVKKYWYLYIFFGIFSGFYRIYAGSHFVSDVFVGACIGVFCAYTIVELFKKHIKYSL
ncbi:MAG: glycosyltransferase family 39 protein [Endomicrobium sp.]|jgi:undecaprenyl-diphosphatase|nr:glycosyltransferase family 39 protein [Endomicrobium sp.]